MEPLISIITVSFSFLVVIFVEKVLHAKPITRQQVLTYQNDLSLKVKEKDGPNGMVVTYLYAKNQLREIRDDNKMYILVFSGIILFLKFVVLELFGIASNDNICFITISAIVLICYAIVEASESNRLAIALYSTLAVSSIIFHTVFKKILMLSTDSLLYSLILIATIGAFTFFRKLEKE